MSSRIALAVVVYLLAATTGAFATAAVEQDSDWYTADAVSARWASVNRACPLPLTTHWMRTLPGAVRAPIVGGMGMVFVGCEDHGVYALSAATGEIKWRFDAGASVRQTPTIITRHRPPTLFVTANNGDLWALDPATGTKRWHVAGYQESPFTSSTCYIPFTPAVPQTNSRGGGPGWIIYTLMRGGVATVRAVHSVTGAILWEKQFGGFGTGTPMYAPRHGLYVGDGGVGSQKIVKYNAATGVEDTVFEAGMSGLGLYEGSDISGAADFDLRPQRLYMSGRWGFVEARNLLTGTVIWSTALPDASAVAGLALTQHRQQNVLVTAQSSNLTALDPSTGAIRWSVPVTGGGGIDASEPRPIVWGSVAVHATGGRIQAFSLVDGSVVWGAALPGGTFASPTAINGRLYIGTESGTVLAFGPGT
jgi:outer membrane protein assembly factor BamB